MLDEPLAGIDVLSRERILHAIVHEYRVGDQTMLLATHELHVAEGLFDRVIVLNDGRVALAGLADELPTQRGASIEEIAKEVYAWPRDRVSDPLFDGRATHASGFLGYAILTRHGRGSKIPLRLEPPRFLGLNEATGQSDFQHFPSATSRHVPVGRNRARLLTGLLTKVGHQERAKPMSRLGFWPMLIGLITRGAAFRSPNAVTASSLAVAKSHGTTARAVLSGVCTFGSTLVARQRDTTSRDATEVGVCNNLGDE